MIANLQLFRPTRAQLRVLLSPFLYNVICFGRQSGKSTYAINKLLDRAWKKRFGIYWYVAPTYRLAEQMFDRTLFALSDSVGVITAKSYSDLVIELRSGSRIFFKSSDNPAGLLGETLDGLVMDEVAKQAKDVWTKFLMPMLGTTGGWADFLSTPNGFDWFYDLYQNHLTKKNWGAFHAPSVSNPLWNADMIAEARSEMSADLFAQEIMAEFRDIGTGSCYVTFGRHNLLAQNPFADTGIQYSPHLPILVGMDFNMSPMSWILGQNRARDFYWNEEISQDRPDHGLSPTESAAQELVRRVEGHKPGVLIIGDASGKAGQRAAPVGASDYDCIKGVLRKAAIPFQDKTPESNPGIKDRVNTVNAACKAADGIIHMWFNESRCPVAIKDFQRRAWKTGSQTLSFENKDPTIGHMSDAAGYPVCVLAPIKNVGSRPKVHVITRSY